MSADEPADDEREREGTDVRDRLEEEADRAVDQFDEGIVDLLSWVLDTETRARIYVHLRQNPNSTSEEIAEGTGLYPSTVREALAELHDEGTVTRRKRENDGAGNNPYEYATIPPSELVTDVVDDVQQELNTVFNMDRYLGRDVDRDRDVRTTESEPVTINVEEEADVDGNEDATDDTESSADDDSEDADDE